MARLDQAQSVAELAANRDYGEHYLFRCEILALAFLKLHMKK